MYLKTARELKSSNRDLNTVLSKQDEEGEDFNATFCWAKTEEVTTTLSSTAVIMESLYQISATFWVKITENMTSSRVTTATFKFRKLKKMDLYSMKGMCS